VELDVSALLHKTNAVKEKLIRRSGWFDFVWDLVQSQ